MGILIMMEEVVCCLRQHGRKGTSMQQGIAVFVMLLIFALASACVWTAFCHDRMRFVRVAFLYFHGIYFVLSAVKSCLGSADNTLFESFWDIEARTYIHYGLPIAVICLLTLALLLKVKWFSDKRLIDTFCAVMFPGNILLFLINGRISNRAYCVLFVVCACLTIAAKITDRGEFAYHQKQEFGKAVRTAVPCVGAWVVMHCIFLPNELYISNPGEFTGSYAPFLAITVCGALVAAVVLLLGELWLLPKSWMHYMNLFFIEITLMGYIQNVLLNGKMEILDGDEQVWTMTQQIANIVLWLIVIAALTVLSTKKKSLVNIGRAVCVYIILIQTVTLGYLIVTTDLSGNSRSDELTIRSSLEVAEGQNVLVFVLDRFDSSWMETVYEEDADFCAPLHDFTFYRNATSQFANTGPGIPYLLTATAWKEAYGTGYAACAYQDSSLLQDIRQQGFDLGVYTGAYLVSSELYDSISNYDTEVEKHYDIGGTMYTMWKCAMYKTSPFVLKNRYSYYSDDIAAIVKAPQVWDTENDSLFWERLRAEGLTVSDDYTKAYRFYHMHGAHEPYTFSDNMKYDKTGRESGLYSQIRGSMKIVYEYMEQLRALGKYDDATIIITADHGQQTDFIEETGKPQKVSSPVIMIKEPHQTGSQLAVSDVPVSQAEMLASMVRSMGMDHRKYGAALDEVADDNKGERVFINLYPEFVKYTIVGDVWDIGNWRGEKLSE